MTDGRVRVNRIRAGRPAQAIKFGDVVTVSVARGVRVLKVLDGGTRRGPAMEAATLYEEIVPLQSARASAGVGGGGTAEEPPGIGQGRPMHEAGGGRPTRRHCLSATQLR